MFNKPIKRNPITTLSELLQFSYRTTDRATPMTKCQNNGQIAFADESGCVYVTPFRSGIHAILTEAGYKDDCIWVPFSNNEGRPEAYVWLAQIASEENWAETYEDAYVEATKKGIKPVEVTQKLQVKQIFYYNDPETHTIYQSLSTCFLNNQSRDNIGTYIVIDEKTLVICDEYSRTFLVKAKTIINDIVNALIEAGYTRTAHPEWYIRRYEPSSEAETE